MVGYHADVDVLGSTASALSGAVDALETATKSMDPSVCVQLGSARLDAAAGRFTQVNRDEIDGARTVLTAGAEELQRTISAYTDVDAEAGAAFRKA